MAFTKRILELSKTTIRGCHWITQLARSAKRAVKLNERYELMQILLVRHGQSEADILGVHEGRADYHLTELGIKQADLMAQRVKKEFAPELIWSSTLIRAKKTAQILSETVGCGIVYDPDLMEWNNGVLAGLSRSEANLKYPEPVGGHKPHESVKDGESVIEFRMRAEIILSKIISDSGNYNKIAIVSHGGMISNIIQSFLKMPVYNDNILKTGDTGIHLLELKGDKKVIHFLNSTEHLNYLQEL